MAIGQRLSGRTIVAIAVAAIQASCTACNGSGAPPLRVDDSHPSDRFAAARAEMVVRQIAARGVGDPRVLAAMAAVPRHEFIAADLRGLAYADRPLPIEHQQTISQPYIVALMTELARVGERARVLEVGTGSGYQAAVLAQMGADVYSIEIIEPLARSAAATLARLGYDRVHVRYGDGYRGWPEEAPFDAILVTAAPPRIPEPLREQLAVGGRLIVPVGTRSQELLVVERTADGFTETNVLPVRFVPMTGEVQAD